MLHGRSGPTMLYHGSRERIAGISARAAASVVPDAADSAPDGQDFDPGAHGHRAEVVGDETLEAIHIKLMNVTG